MTASDARPPSDAERALGCLTCNGWNPVSCVRRRETKGLVCQSCGWDYANGEPRPPSDETSATGHPCRGDGCAYCRIDEMFAGARERESRPAKPDTWASLARRAAAEDGSLIVVDPVEAREKIAQAHRKVADEWRLSGDLPDYALEGLLIALDVAVLAALAGGDS